MYPHVGVDASGLATLRATVLDRLRGFVPTAYAVPAFATPVPAGPCHTGPCYALAESGAAVGRRARRGAGSGTSTAPTTTRRPSADSDSARMLDLVERAQAGEAEAFGRLYDQYADTVYRYIYYRVGGRATAEDLTSETFLRALRRIGTFTWQGRDFGAWLVTIARNLVADHFKSSRFRLEVTTGEMLDANEVERSPEDSVLESLSNAALLEAVRKLNPQQQECVTLRFLQGLSVAETARVMGKNEGAIKTLQYRAVRTLARLLPDDAR
ncbi:ECF subfamily RNA polymerase sigma factor, BldN family [Streptomyces albireticuli]|uniref:RNA polymerase subunit sigma-24 n=1 Tax=Streptomyces albireticuli TaxID=1940 RepID=A0A2A2CXT8_9ACTN|nr:ECF subfamily RNA polymerase sigma factor, BldN family [Streptomyces albireticuli]MCD9144860.1 sigma-70 family RNA polymerase sigma factor [Streptomyces albireticuli]MCD9165729.1 sigma-70 family RNA polymerase sigma factor [Streptomyces albireticuli]MCD9193767.1 sigma-70 family RNA polymerase sigma factor [Streptomyces albireticuli]PAU44081.1 RNA polymerase subunit sigma-24 [Streptomyces albireticuli]